VVDTWYVLGELRFEALRQLEYFKALAFPESVQGRLASGQVCHGFFLDQRLVNIAWTTAGYLGLEPGATISQSRSVGIFDCFTITRLSFEGHLPRNSDYADAFDPGQRRRCRAHRRGSRKPAFHQGDRTGRLRTAISIDQITPVWQRCVTKQPFEWRYAAKRNGEGQNDANRPPGSTRT
jgi:hypothetical protein